MYGMLFVGDFALTGAAPIASDRSAGVTAAALRKLRRPVFVAALTDASPADVSGWRNFHAILLIDDRWGAPTVPRLASASSTATSTSKWTMWWPSSALCG